MRRAVSASIRPALTQRLSSPEIDSAMAAQSNSASEHLLAEVTNHWQPVEPCRGVRAPLVDRTDWPRESGWDLTHPHRWVVVLEIVVLHARHHEIVGHRHVDRAHAEARQLGR